jgi:hypothetical protein
LLAVRLPVDCVPDVAFVPDQPFDAVHEVALVDDQVRVDAAPELIEVGFAVSETVGAGIAPPVTAIVTAPYPVVPSLLVQVSEKRVSAFSAPVLLEPFVAFAPDQPPDAAQLAAFVVVHESIVDPPALMLIGLAVMLTVGVIFAGGCSLSSCFASSPHADKTMSEPTSVDTRNARRKLNECIRSIPRTVK